MTTDKKGAAWLAAEIKQLEDKESLQQLLFREQVKQTLESLKPSSMVKSAFHSVTAGKNFKGNLVNASIGIGAGLLAKKWYMGASKSIFKKVAGWALQKITTRVVTSKLPAIIRNKFS